MALSSIFVFIVFCCSSLIQNVASADYGPALTKCLLFFEGQRSGKLPPKQRVQWRGDSGLKDGQDAGIDLVGGYYDAGDNLKLGFPMAFTITMLSWSTIEFKDKLAQKNELANALSAIRWGTDYLMKANPQPDILYGEVGDADSDHACWQRPEDMTTPRNSFRIDDPHPGSDLAAETAAALAAASIVFQPVDQSYASKMLNQAIQLFEFARYHQGLYQESIRPGQSVYSSSGFKDEMLWAALWLQRATKNNRYLGYIEEQGDSGGLRSQFSWDDKYIGVQILATKLMMEGTIGFSGLWAQYKIQLDHFICSCAQKESNNVEKTPGSLLWFQPWNNVQYVSTATFAISVYSQYLSARNGSIQCSSGFVSPSDLTSLVLSQVDYILGSNPKGMSYMVGYGSNYPKKIHHRGASIVSFRSDPAPVTCKGGFDLWFNKDTPNPNVLEGAVVSPDKDDNFMDSRSDYQLAEPTTVTNAPLLGALAYLA